MLPAGPANLQRVPSPLLYVGRRGAVPFVAEVAAARLAAVSVAYLAGVSTHAIQRAAAALACTGPIRCTQDGKARRTQAGALRVLPTVYLLAARAEPIEAGAQRLAAVSATYTGLPSAAVADSAAQHLSANASTYQAAASASPIESVTVVLAAAARAYQPAGIRETSRLARQRFAAVSATYSLA